MRPPLLGRLLILAFGAVFLSYSCYSDRRANQVDAEAATESQPLALEREGGSSTPAQSEGELDASNRVRPIYAGVLSRIRGRLNEHVNETGDSRITIDLPAIPENLYRDRYSGTVTFGAAVVWTVEIFAPRPADPRSPPTLTIRFDDPNDLQEGPRLIFALDTAEREVAIIVTNGIPPSVGPLPGAIPMAEPDAVVAQLIRSIVEGQLLSLGWAAG